MIPGSRTCVSTGRTAGLGLTPGNPSYLPQRPRTNLRLSKEDINEVRRERKKKAVHRARLNAAEETPVPARRSEWESFVKTYGDSVTSAHRMAKSLAMITQLTEFAAR